MRNEVKFNEMSDRNGISVRCMKGSAMGKLITSSYVERERCKL